MSIIGDSARGKFRKYGRNARVPLDLSEEMEAKYGTKTTTKETKEASKKNYGGTLKNDKKIRNKPLPQQK